MLRFTFQQKDGDDKQLWYFAELSVIRNGVSAIRENV
jgi:hypothetical protein